MHNNVTVTILSRGRKQLPYFGLRRWFCSSSGARGAGGMPSRDKKRRFYVEVDITPCLPPWDDETKNYTDGFFAKSAISAGVDGTDSASGVSRVAEVNQERLQQLLRPRKPRTTKADDGPDNNLTNNPIEWFTVTLDGRALRTPLGRKLCVPSKHLAHGIANEWNAVGMNAGGSANVGVLNSNYIIPTQMPFMTLTCTALDQTSTQTQTYQQQCLRYLHTDTVCYWADPVEDRILYGRQQNAWKELHEWIVTEFAPDQPAVAIGHMESMMLAKNRKGLGHPTTLVNFCEKWVASLDAWHLTALFSICAETKSFWIGAAILVRNYTKKINKKENNVGNKDITKQKDFKMDIDRAIAAARVEEEFNIEFWGLVEGGHDYDRLNASVQVASASLFTDYLALTLNAAGES